MHGRAIRVRCELMTCQRWRSFPTTFQRTFIHAVSESKERAKETRPTPPVDEDRVDKRVWPIALSTFITGSAIGVALPVMPMFAAEMGLTTAEFGLVGSVFGASRLLSNLPMAVASERFGRRPFLVFGPIVAGISMVGTGLSGSLPVLLGWRVLTGLGGSAQITGAQNYLADISKPSNRARTLAPMSAAFSAGASVGPAIGGVLAEHFGVAPCFFYVGGAIGGVGLLNYCLLPETKVFAAAASKEKRVVVETGAAAAVRGESGNDGGVPKQPDPAGRGWLTSTRDTLATTFVTWRRIASDRTVSSVLLAHLSYWCVLSGSQFTLMPVLASEHLGMSPGAIGTIYAMVSATNVVGSQFSAHASDKYGRKKTIVPGLALIALAVSGIPYAADGTQLTALMFLWSVGGAFVSTGPTAFLADLVREEDRSQALAMLRSCGDLGLLVGAGATGVLAHTTSMETAFLANAVLLAAATANMALRAEEKDRTQAP